MDYIDELRAQRILGSRPDGMALLRQACAEVDRLRQERFSPQEIEAALGGEAVTALIRRRDKIDAELAHWSSTSSPRADTPNVQEEDRVIAAAEETAARLTSEFIGEDGPDQPD
jgi:hypothetical protein